MSWTWWSQFGFSWPELLIIFSSYKLALTTITIRGFWTFLTGRFVTDYFNHFHIGRMSPQLGCSDTCSIWIWYSIANMCFDNAEKVGKWRDGGDSLTKPHPRKFLQAPKENFRVSYLQLSYPLFLICSVRNLMTAPHFSWSSPSKSLVLYTYF